MKTTAWALGIDFGTSYTAAAIAAGDRVDVLEIDGQPRMPSLILLGEDGEIVVGQSAVQQAPLFPGRVERAPKRYLGVPRPLLVDGAVVRPVEAVARILGVVLAEARRRRGGTEPAAVVLTHPARWAAARTEALVEAARLAGIRDPVLTAEPVAAARYFGEAHLTAGQYVAVYDLGGGTFDTAVLRRTEIGYELAGPPGGEEDLGGEAFDDRLFRYLGEQLDPAAWDQLQRSTDRRWRQARAALRGQARDAKEALSRDNAYSLAIPLPVDQQLRVTRGELEDLIRFDLRQTMVELAETIRAAGLGPGDLAAIYLVGGSSRLPLVSRLLSETFDRLPETWDDPKAVVSLGAARQAAALSAPAGSVEVPVPPIVIAPPAEPEALAPDPTPLAETEPLAPALLAEVATATIASGSAPPAPPTAPAGGGGPTGSAGRRRRPSVLAPLLAAGLVLVIAAGALGARYLLGGPDASPDLSVSPSSSSDTAVATGTPLATASPGTLSVSVSAAVDDADGIVSRGQQVGFVVDISVTGRPLTDAVLTEHLADGLTLVAGSQTSSPAATSAVVSADGRTLTWTYDSLLGALTIGFSTTVGPAASGIQATDHALCGSELTSSCPTSNVTISVAVPPTQAPATPKPATPKPATPKPATPKPATPKPATPKPATPAPPTPAPPTPAPTPVNRPPYVNNTSGYVTFDVSAYCASTRDCYIFVLDLVADPDGDPITLVSVSATYWGNTIFKDTYNGKQVAHWIAKAGFAQPTDSFYFNFSDGHNPTVQAICYVQNIPPP